MSYVCLKRPCFSFELSTPFALCNSHRWPGYWAENNYISKDVKEVIEETKDKDYEFFVMSLEKFMAINKPILFSIVLSRGL